MAPSSQSQSQFPPSSSPHLKRKQPSISSFFTKKPQAQSQSPSQSQSQLGSQGQENGSTQRPVKSVVSGKNKVEEAVPRKKGDFAAEGKDEDEDEDDDEDDVVTPAAKRARTNGQQSQNGTSTSPKRPSPDDRPPQSQALNSSQRTELFKFTSSPANGADGVEEGDEAERRQRQREREKLHKQFVRRLGGADCVIGIGSRATNDVAVGGEDAEEVEEDDEPQRPAKKGTAAGKAGGKLTPLEKQIIEFKRGHMDAVLAVQVGYKFRFFGDDARVAARELGIVCIPGKMRFDEHPSEAHLSRFASASIPIQRLHVHVKRLVTAGHKVGIVRQIETAALKAAGDNRNAPFGRKLTNLYTKATYVDDMEGLEGPVPAASGGVSPATGYMLCISESNARGWGNDEKVHVGIVAVQPTTGDVVYDDFEDGFMRSEIETRLLHIAPCELVIVGELSSATEKLVQHLSGSKSHILGDNIRVARAPKSKTAAAEAHSHISSFYADKMKADKGAGDAHGADLLQKVLNLPELVTVCLSAMIKHMEEYGLEHVFDLTKYFQHFSSRTHMLLNGNTLMSLEIYHNQTDHTTKGSLFWTLDRTRTRFGQRMLRKWVGRPLLDKGKLEERVNAVSELKDSKNRTMVERLRGLIGRIKTDLEKSLIRIYYGKCTRPELLTLLQTLQMIAQEFSDVKAPGDSGFTSPILTEVIASLPTMLQEVVSFLERINLHAARNDDKYEFFRESHETEEISEQKLGIGSVEHELQEHRADAGQALGRKVVYATVSGIDHLIEVENSGAAIKRVPASWVKINGTKKVSRFHTPEVIQMLRQRDQHKEALAAACDQAFADLLAEISTNYQGFRDCVLSLATLDCLLSLATIAEQPGYVKPEYTDHTCINVEQGRHPMVEQLLLDSYVPNDISLDTDQTRALLVTGPNMGGKSSYVRQIALIAIMGQIGSYVPAQSAKLGMLDAVFTRMGAFDNMLAGESTFMVELSETADILKQATPRSLVILDELGRGTSTHDGVAIAQAVLDYIVRTLHSLTLFITHYQHLSSMVHSFPDHELRNVHMRFTESGTAGSDENITFLYEVGEGVAHRSYGLNVARLANLPSSLLELAKEKSAELEASIRRRRLVGLVEAVGEVVGGDGQEGRLQQATLDLLAGCDIQFRRETRLDIALVKNLPIALIFLPAADIPTFVGEGRVDLGITGRDQVAEHDAQLPAGSTSNVEEIMDLGFGGCKLQVQVPVKGDITEAKQLVGRNIVTSFTGLTGAFFSKLEGVSDVSDLRTDIKYVGGSVEAACALGVADGIVDLVESGETMRAAGLKAIDTVVESTSVLVKSKNTKNPLVDLITSRINGVITAQKYVLCQYNIPRAELATASNITPGKRAPTVTALEEDGWVAVSSMVEKKKIATVMDELTKVGASDILVLTIANSRTG
ncbi:DNA mismatch repair protein Msh3 [Aspergillus taichungensis]|uniref:ATP phosphoribosyltransferase n=1 Tax=Aspergillus taichungensis TaxID=482145 RepID=A0A2J5HEZ0_9EURO|nr:DNA mismatch repair protein Msh3 [Aspergillus taichungensis]